MEEEQASDTVGQSEQGAWTRWESIARCRVTWSNRQTSITSGSLSRLSTMPHHIQQTFTSGVRGRDLPALFALRGSTENLLSNCGKAPGEGCYCWHLEQVLRAVAGSIASGISISRQHASLMKSLTFVKAGQGHLPPPKARSSPLYMVSDWELRVNLGKHLKLQ